MILTYALGRVKGKKDARAGVHFILGAGLTSD